MRNAVVLICFSLFAIQTIFTQNTNQQKTYEVFITKPEGENAIAKKDWFNYIQMDSSLKSIESKNKNSDNSNISLIRYSYNDSKFIFEFNNGFIRAKNPTKEILLKMYQVSKRLNAVVIDSNGKVFTDDDFYKN
ncbi:hypothetical protein BTO06_03800 [Tenacibaculum sp. SZ-18]|uniref:hypothetical protein n=1 Tax=Tenacibaculum sp. SZ-18 TaxID=754423 RepID=UPI000C2D5AC9|nr:hypothetical protein [Tenacibaculum sp. SZ-18]AUC14319.1 hypothetical protein BTO06_03800 [Tenacibaculum sp. SZ-18]